MGGGFQPGAWDQDKLDKGTRARIPTPSPGALKAKNGSTDKTNPKALIPVADFVRYVEEIEKIYPKWTPEEVVRSLRELYYNDLGFDRLMPAAPRPSCTPSLAGRVCMRKHIEWNRGAYGLPPISADASEHLTARAHENASADENPDNPSPYIVMPNGERIDVGHLLLTLDALLNPGSGRPFTTYSVRTIDPASWVADVGIAAVWMEFHEDKGKPHDDVKNPPAKPDKDIYWLKSAPTEDILGDSDGFGLFDLWNASTNKRLSEVLRAYYLDPDGKVKKRWQVFCSRNGFEHTWDGSSVTWKDAGLQNKTAVDFRKELIDRIDTFNNLYNDGGLKAFGTVINPIGKPSTKKFKYTPYMLNKFMDWVKDGLTKELKAAAQSGKP